MFVFVARLIEAFIHYAIMIGAIGRGDFIEHELGSFDWHRFIATQIWIFVLFLIYVTGSEINEMLADGELFKIFFVRRSSGLKSARRARIRLLIRLARLTDAYSIEELGASGTAQHAELVAILHDLTGGSRTVKPA